VWVGRKQVKEESALLNYYSLKHSKPFPNQHKDALPLLELKGGAVCTMHGNATMLNNEIVP